MANYRRSVRRMLLAGSCVASALVGLAAVWVFAPSGFFRLDTADLLAVVALVLLPALTVWAVRGDRAAQAESAERPGTGAPRATPEAGPAQRAPRKSVIHEPAYFTQAEEQQRV